MSEFPLVLQMVAGPTTVPEDVRTLYAQSYGSADLEPQFFEDYGKLCERLQRLLYTKNDVVVMMGEVWCECAEQTSLPEITSCRISGNNRNVRNSTAPSYPARLSSSRIFHSQAMVCLWSGLKSVIVPGDRVLAVRYSAHTCDATPGLATSVHQLLPPRVPLHGQAPFGLERACSLLR